MASLPVLPDPFYQNNPSNPSSAFYVPPTGYYQNDAGQLVPNSTPATNYPTTASALASTNNSMPTMVSAQPIGKMQQTAMDVGNAFGGLSDSTNNAIATIFNHSLEDWIFIVLGLMLIAAGIFSFKQTQQLIQTSGQLAGKVAEVAAA
jgi:hypothetical protein